MSNPRIELMVPVKPVEDWMNSPTHDAEPDYHPSDDGPFDERIAEANAELAEEHAKQKIARGE